MNRLLLFWLAWAILGPTTHRLAAQVDPAKAAAEAADRQEAEERAKRLKAIIEDVVAAQSAQQKRLLALIDDMKVLRDDTAEALGKYATTGDVKKLEDKINALDKRREADKEAITTEVNKLTKALADLTKALASAPAPAPPEPARTERKPPGGTVNTVKIKTPETKTPEVKTPAPPPAPRLEKGVEHTVGKGEVFSTILAAYNAEFKKLGKQQVSQKQVLAANQGMNPNNIRIGQKIFIPVLD